MHRRPSGRRCGPRPAHLPLAGLLVLLAAAAPPALAAQWPGEIRGRVVDAVTGGAIQGATVSVAGAGRTVRTDGAGEFRVRSLDPGAHPVSAAAYGYGEASRTVEVENGAVARVTLELLPDAVPLDELPVEAAREWELGVHRMGRAAVDASGARTADELLRGIPGVTVRTRGPGGPATVSLRGSGEDAVLVLVDGVPLNDPVTGEADLSTLSASAVREIAVYPGARSARYGPRAMGGVILVETRGPEGGLSTRAFGGSLGLYGGEVGTGGWFGRFEAGAAVEATARDGSFPFEQPPEVGGGEAVRRNADLVQGALRLGVAGQVGGGELQGRLQVEEMERGLPGKGFAPSDSARQEVSRTRGSATWTRGGSGGVLRIGASGTFHELVHRDPAPPLSPPFHDRTRLVHGTLRAGWDRTASWRSRRVRLSAGAEADHQRVRASGLSDRAPPARTDLGLRAGADLEWPRLPGRPEASGTLRLHRDGLLEEGIPSHDLTLRARTAGVRLHLAHRSGYSPPTLGDQFFREGVAVAPNPGLEAERIPGEWELGADADAVAGPLQLSGGLALFRGDVRGMIVWAPDFRFVWSPRNVDVRRRGLEAWTELRHPASGLRLSGSHTRSRVTYDRDDSEPVQVLYRPRHTASLTLGWGPRPGWGGELGARYLGRRFPVPAPVNALPPFWSFDLHLRSRLPAGAWLVEPALRVDRLLDRKDAFIFAFPEPGRTWTLEVRVRSPGRDPL